MNKPLSVVLVALLLAACDKPAPTEPAADIAAVPAASAATAPAADSAGDQATDGRINGLLGDHAPYRAAFTQLQQAVAAKDAAAVAAMVDYPFVATIDGRKIPIHDAAAFVAQYDKIVTPAIAEVIARQKYSELFVNAEGVMFGSGQVWLNGICEDKACKALQVKVVAIQPGG